MIHGAIASLVTPFTDSGDLDYKALHQHSGRMSQAGFDVLCFSGGTGEFLSLTDEERIEALKVVVDGSDGLPVLASALFTAPRDVLNYAERAAMTGAKAIMVMPPYFYVQSQQDIKQHLLKIAKESALPVLLFNSMGRSGRVMSPDTVLSLAHSSENFIGIKETTERIDDIAMLAREAPTHFAIIQAHEPLVLPSYAVGAVGSFGSLCNIIPIAIVRLHAAIESGDLLAAQDLSNRITRVADAAYAVTIPVGIKYLMNALKTMHTTVRPPLSLALDEDSRKTLEAIIPAIQQLEGEFGLQSA